MKCKEKEFYCYGIDKVGHSMDRAICEQNANGFNNKNPPLYSS